MTSGPLVSVLVTNHNYARYLREAVDSALRQTYPRVEVVVVDDGSTDGSREILAGYGDRIITHLKTNGGLGSAINAGVERCRGELVALLDADDVFVDKKMARVVEAYVKSPASVLIYHRLQTIDTEGRPHGVPWHRALPSGDVRKAVSDSGGWWPRPTTSAMTFTRAFLERILPLRECGVQGKATWPDAYAGDLAPFFGEIQGLRQTLAMYRVHGKNSQSSVDPKTRVRQVEFEYEQLRSALVRFGQGDPLAPLTRHPGYLECAYGVEPSVKLGSLLGAILRHPSLPLDAKFHGFVRAMRRAVR